MNLIATVVTTSVIVLPEVSVTSNIHPGLFMYNDIGLRQEGDWRGFYYTDADGFAVEFDTSISETIPLYTLPDNATDCGNATMALDLFNLLPMEIKQSLCNEFHDLDELVRFLGLRLDQFVDVGDLADAYDIWESFVQNSQIPVVGDVIRTIFDCRPAVQVAIRGVGKQTEWIIGDNNTCEGTDIDRRNSTDKRCNGAIAVQFGRCIAPTYAFHAEADADTSATASPTALPTISPTVSPTFQTISIDCNFSDPSLRRECKGQQEFSKYLKSVDRGYYVPFVPPLSHTHGPATRSKADYRVLRQLVVLVRFSDHRQRNLPSREYYDYLFNARQDSYLEGSVRDYFLENSYGTVDVLSTVTDWIDVDFTEAYTANNGGGTGCSDNKDCDTPKILQEVMMFALANMAEANPDLDISSVIGDPTTHVIFVTSGYPGEYHTAPPSVALSRIISHVKRFENIGKTINKQADSVESKVVWDTDIGNMTLVVKTQKFGFQLVILNRFAVIAGCYGDGSDGSSCASESVRVGVIVHEMLHLDIFGKPLGDLYETTPRRLKLLSGDTRKLIPDHCIHKQHESSNARGAGIGGFGVLGDIWGPQGCNEQRTMPMVSAFTKVLLGWGTLVLADTEGGHEEEYYLGDASSAGDVLGFITNLLDGEFFLIEQREQGSYDYAHSGTVVYHVDLKAYQELRYVPRHNDKPNYDSKSEHNKHYFVRVEQADGMDQMECTNELLFLYDENDAFGEGSKISEGPRPGPSLQGYSKALYDSDKEKAPTMTFSKRTRFESGGYSILVKVVNTSIGSKNMRSRVPRFKYNDKCEAGSYAARDGSCKLCPVGKYSLAGGIGHGACNVCPDGSYSDLQGTSECIACPTGTYDDITFYPSNGSSCKECPNKHHFKSLVPLKTWLELFCVNPTTSKVLNPGTHTDEKQVSYNCATPDENPPTDVEEEQYTIIIISVLSALILLICLIASCSIRSEPSRQFFWHIFFVRSADCFTNQWRPSLSESNVDDTKCSVYISGKCFSTSKFCGGRCVSGSPYCEEHRCDNLTCSEPKRAKDRFCRRHLVQINASCIPVTKSNTAKVVPRRHECTYIEHGENCPNTVIETKQHTGLCQDHKCANTNCMTAVPKHHELCRLCCLCNKLGLTFAQDSRMTARSPRTGIGYHDVGDFDNSVA